MLESIRNAAQGGIGKAIMTVVMGLIIVSFVIWGVGDMLRGFTSTTVASVGSEKISAQDYRFAYQRTLQQYQRRLHQSFTNEQARAIGLDREVLQRLLSEAALDEEAHRLGLNISEDALRTMITSNPNFRDKAGNFDPEALATALRDNDMTERMFVSDMRKTALRQFLLAALTTGVKTPKVATKALADYASQVRSADYFVLPASAAGDIPAPSADALKSFFEDRKSSYRAPERRALEIVSLEPEALANPAEVSDADAQAAYDRVAGRDPKYGAPEKRDLEQILFPNQAEADAAAAKMRAGASFDDIVKERNLKPEDTAIGETTKDAMIDKTEADAVFALPKGGVSGVLTSQFGPVIVRVKGVTPSTVKPYAEVADDIKRQISASRAGDKISAIRDKVEDARVSGKSLADAAKDAGLKAEAVPAVDARGLGADGKPVALPDKTDLLRAAFASDVGLDEAPLQTKDRGVVWFSVSKVEPAHERTLDEAKDEVEAQWRAEQIDKALAGKADDLVRQLRSGATIAVLARSAGVEPKTAADVTRDEKTKVPESLVAAIFREPADGSGSASIPDGRAVFKITADKTPPIEAIDPRVKAISEELDTATRDSILEQYVEALRAKLGVTIHRDVLQSAEGS